jgi:YcaO-like protein with predicted kinase domain
VQLESRKKWTVNGTSRTRPAQETLDKVVPLSKKIGVTRLADITDMDVLRIPNYSAVLPGTEDYIWVYSGKGQTREHAKASALMESIERYSALPSGGKHRALLCIAFGRAAQVYKVKLLRSCAETQSAPPRRDCRADAV